MALAFTYRLAANQPQGEAKPLQAGPDALSPAPQAQPLGMGSGPWLPDLEPAATPPAELAAAPELFAHGAIRTMAASEPAARPDSGLGFSCLDLLAGFAESGP
jgi:hypothetical protein